MKRFLAIIVFVFAFSTTVQAHFVPSFAVSAGLPVGDIKDQTSFAVSADLYFTKSINSTLGLGVTTGYSIYFGKEYNNGVITTE